MVNEIVCSVPVFVKLKYEPLIEPTTAEVSLITGLILVVEGTTFHDPEPIDCGTVFVATPTFVAFANARPQQLSITTTTAAALFVPVNILLLAFSR